MKFVRQLDYPEWIYVTKTELDEEARKDGEKTTVASSACGLCAAVMVADRLLVKYDFDLEKAMELAYRTKANHKVGTDYKIYAPAVAELLDLKLEMTSDPERLRYCLRTGGAAVVHCGGDKEGRIGVFSHGGHYITAVSELEDGRIAILDPDYSDGKFDEEGRKGQVEFRGVLCIVDMEVLVEDSSTRTPSYYLFWRN
ncbi:MAG: hypothetical protein IJ486_09715 [Firmicutes bacterium]|nr:hypothetical protein [Bacillota bacterium]